MATLLWSYAPTTELSKFWHSAFGFLYSNWSDELVCTAERQTLTCTLKRGNPFFSNNVLKGGMMLQWLLYKYFTVEEHIHFAYILKAKTDHDGQDTNGICHRGDLESPVTFTLVSVLFFSLHIMINHYADLTYINWSDVEAFNIYFLCLCFLCGCLK